MSTKFSQFADAGTLSAGDIVVGLNAGNNAKFTFPSITGFTWNNTVSDTDMDAGNGYIVNSAVLVTLTMSATLVRGDLFEVTAVGAGGWAIQLNAGQTIRLGSDLSSAAGSLSSTSIGDSVRLVATSTTSLSVLSSIGNITIA